MNFTHLQIRTGYSFMKSSVQLANLIKRAKDLNFHSLALTDEGVLYHAISFYQACKANDINPILGMVVNFTYEEEEGEAIVLAKSTEGYRELIHLSTVLQTKDETAFMALFKKTDQLIFILKANHPFIANKLHQGEMAQLESILSTMYERFDQENVYLGIERLSPLDDFLLETAQELSVELVALHDVRYVYEEEVLSYEILQAISQNRTWSASSLAEESKDRHLRSTEEMREHFSTWEKLLHNTEKIANQCHVTLEFDRIQLPAFPVPRGESATTYLKNKCLKSLKAIYQDRNERLKAEKRLTHELDIIQELGFSDYFLIVADFVQFAKEANIAVGPGRGSAAGSLVAYLLGITDVDPLSHNLLFERFLNPERVSMPDIDIDFSDNRREEVIDYVRERYGEDYVAQIITFGTFQARSSLREVMKVMQIDESDQKYILSHIPHDRSISIAASVRREPELVKYIKQSKKLRLLFKVAIQLEGLPRHMSIHPAGIVIGKYPLLENVPLTKGNHDTYITQYAMDDLEAIGLLKIDILGLKNLTLIERIVESINKYKDEQFSLEKIPANDPKTFKLLQAGQTNGIFQFESAGMKQMLIKVKPTSLDDLVALNALYRPGPMKHIDTYTKRKHQKEAVVYLHPDLEAILQDTYGVLVYQEQIMQIVHRFASYSLGEADLLRRAISNKDHQEMQGQKARFIAGCLANGYDRHVAEELFRWIVTFADYGFNKSHSVAYSKLAYILAYLKANYPAYFFAQLLSSSMGSDGQKRSSYIREAQELEIPILPPSINKSHAYFAVEKEAIRFGLMAIKGIGYDTVEKILEARKEKAFKHLFDFVLRVNIKRNALETLILAGAFDETNSNRASLLASITPAIERAELFGGYGEGALFKDSLDMKATYVDMEDFSLMQKLADEQALLGTYMSTHPLKKNRAILKKLNYLSIKSMRRMNQGAVCQLLVFTPRIKKIRTRRGDSMAFITLSDETDEIEAVVFSNVWRRINQLLEENQLYDIRGRVSVRKGEKQLLVDQVYPFTLEDLERYHIKHVFLRMVDNDRYEALHFLRELAKTHSGSSIVIVHDERSQETFKLSKEYALFCTETCIEKLNSFFGTKNVVLK